LSAAVGESVLQQNAAEADVDLEALRAGTATDVRLLDPNAEQSDARSGVAFAFVITFFITALSFGMVIAQSVVQEKESRVVEILAAAVPIRSLLWGKIAGNTVLALGQVLLIGAVGVVGLVATGQRDLLAGVGWSMIAYVGFFVLGFLTLACLWSVAGAIAGRQEDLQSTTLPGQLILMVPYFIAVLGGDQVRTVFSMLPIVSTMIMPGRLAEGTVPWWQLAVAVAATLVAAVVFVRVGTRLYERTLLRTGGKLTYRQALAAADA
jgi:ABC-2 type transport system permease protein